MTLASAQPEKMTLEANDGTSRASPENKDRLCSEDQSRDRKEAECSLLDAVLAERTEHDRSAIEARHRRLDGLQVDSPEQAAEALVLWFGRDALANTVEISLVIGRAVAAIDALLTDQVNAILHHPEFQQLEASWRGLCSLVDQVGSCIDGMEQDEDRWPALKKPIEVKMLNVSRRDLERDAEGAAEFDQTKLFKLVYEEEFGMAGGHPFGLLIGDFDFGCSPRDLEALTLVRDVAASAFAPFVAAADPSLLGLKSFAELEREPSIEQHVSGPEFIRWRSFRDDEDSRFLGLVLPRVLMRQPYGDDPLRGDGFTFREDASAPDGSGCLWGRPVYAFAAVVARSFAHSGWLADIRGVRREDAPPNGRAGGGLVTDLPVQRFATDADAIAFSTDVAITDHQEREMADAGFIPLCPCAGTELSAFYAVPSIQRAKTYDDALATTNSQMSAMLHYMLCASRFAHYLKVIMRDKTGSFIEPTELQDQLNSWLVQYVTADENADPATKARLPLAEAHVDVRARPAEPGRYDCEIHLRPHHQLDALAGAIRLVAVAQGGT